MKSTRSRVEGRTVLGGRFGLEEGGWWRNAERGEFSQKPQLKRIPSLEMKYSSYSQITMSTEAQENIGLLALGFPQYAIELDCTHFKNCFHQAHVKLLGDSEN